MIFSSSQPNKEVGEIKYPINQLGYIWDFIKANTSLRYNIVIPKDFSDIERIKQQVEYIVGVGAKYTIECHTVHMYRQIKEAGLNGYILYPIVDWESFNILKSIGVTDIYIDGALGFQTDKLKEAKDKVKIRVSPQYSPNASIGEEIKPNSFFIRPEDLHFYEDVVDIVDFCESDKTREETLLNIYKRGSFDFELDNIVKELRPSALNSFIRDDFCQNRLNCGQKCLVPGHGCHICNTQLVIASNMTRFVENYKYERGSNES